MLRRPAPGAGRPSGPGTMCGAYMGLVRSRTSRVGSSRRSQWTRLIPASLGPLSVRTTSPFASRIWILISVVSGFSRTSSVALVASAFRRTVSGFR